MIHANVPHHIIASRDKNSHHCQCSHHLNGGRGHELELMTRHRRPDPSSEQPEIQIEEALELLADEYARQILKELVGTASPASALVDRCEFSRPTVYRRLDQLEEAGLIDADLEVDPNGHHRKVYHNVLEEINLSLCPDGVTGEVESSRSINPA